MKQTPGAILRIKKQLWSRMHRDHGKVMQNALNAVNLKNARRPTGNPFFLVQHAPANRSSIT